MIFNIRLKGQELMMDDVVLAEKELDAVFCKITADSAWDGLSIRLVFRNVSPLGMIARKVVVTDRDKVTVPSECMVDGWLFANAIGVADGGARRLTTADMAVGRRVYGVSALDADGAKPIEPDEYDQILALDGDLSSVGVADTTSVAVILGLMAAQIGDVSKLDTDNLVDALRALPQYRRVGDLRDYNAYIANIQGDGAYAIFDSQTTLENWAHDWRDRPADGEFALIVLQCSEECDLQLAFSRETAVIFVRFVSRTATDDWGNRTVLLDWSPQLTQKDFDDLHALIQKINKRVSEIEKNGGGSATGGAKVFLPDEVPEKPKDGDLQIKKLKVGEGGMPLPFVTEPQMRSYVDGKIPTVPYWAMQPNKPTYTAEEVGAATPEDITKALANLPAGGSDKWEFIGEFTLPEDSAEWYITEDAEGNPIELKEAFFGYIFEPAANYTADTQVHFGNPAWKQPFEVNAIIRTEKALKGVTSSWNGEKAYHLIYHRGKTDKASMVMLFFHGSTTGVNWNSGIESYHGHTKNCIGGLCMKTANAETSLIGAGSKIQLWGARI